MEAVFERITDEAFCCAELMLELPLSLTDKGVKPKMNGPLS